MTCQHAAPCNCPRACRHLKYCVKKRFLHVHEDELAQPEIVRSMRQTVFERTRAKRITPMGCREWLSNLYRDHKLQIINQSMRPVEVDTECLEPTDTQINNDTARIFDEQLREFFRGNACAPPRGGCRVFVTQRWHKPFMSMATIVGASVPEQSQWWPRIIRGQYVDPRVANDNRPVNTSSED